MRKIKRDESTVSAPYTRALDVEPVSHLVIPEYGTRPEVAYRYIHDDMLLDGNSRLNLATFVTTWMEPEAATLMAEALTRT